MNQSHNQSIVVLVKFFILVGSLSLGSSAMAKGTQTKKRKVALVSKYKKSSSNSRQVSTKRSRGSSSSDHRHGKTLGAVAGFGLINFNARKFAAVNYFINPNHQIEAGVGQAQFTFLGLGTTYNDTFVQWKHYFTNSFYGNLGASYINFQSKDKLIASNGIDEGDSYQADHASVYYGIGNRWQFSWLTIGCDWVGYGATLAQSNEKYTYSGGEGEKSQEKFLSDHRSVNSQLYLVNFHLGASF